MKQSSKNLLLFGVSAVLSFVITDMAMQKVIEHKRRKCKFPSEVVVIKEEVSK